MVRLLRVSVDKAFEVMMNLDEAGIHYTNEKPYVTADNACYIQTYPVNYDDALAVERIYEAKGVKKLR